MNDSQSDSDDNVIPPAFTISVDDGLDDSDNDIDYGETVTPSVELLLQQRQMYLLSQQDSSLSSSMATGNVTKATSERTLPSWMCEASIQKEEGKKRMRKTEYEKGGSDDGMDSEGDGTEGNRNKKTTIRKQRRTREEQATTRNAISSSSASSSSSPSFSTASSGNKNGKNRNRNRNNGSGSGRSRLPRRGRDAGDDDSDDDDLPSSSEDDEYEEEVTESQFRKELQEIERKRRRVKAKKTVPRSEILAGVTICISGIQNPERARIRQHAMGMGARYSGDWNQGCTHLICAIGNTPKLADARRSNSWVVTKDWILACDRRNMRVPEKQFDFDSPQLELSDDDMYDEGLISEESESESEEEEFNDGKFGEEAMEDDEDLHAHPEDEWVPPSERKNKNKRPSNLKTSNVVLGFSDLSDEEEDSDEEEKYDMMQNERRQKKQKMKRKKNGEKEMVMKGSTRSSTIESISTDRKTSMTDVHRELLDRVIIAGDVANLLHAAEDISQEPAKLIRDIMTTALRHLLLHGSLDDSFLDKWNYNKVRVPKSLRKIIMLRPPNNSSMVVRPYIISLLKHAMLEELWNKGAANRTSFDELPSALDGLTIKFGNDIAVNQEQRKLLNRIGNFLGAEVLESKDSSIEKTTTHIIATSACPDQRNVSRFVQVVRPEWLEKCMQTLSYVDEEPFLIPY